MPNLTIVRDKPALSDIPAMLRKLARDIEAREVKNVEALYVLIPVPGGDPMLYGWCDIKGKNDPIIQCELAKLWLLRNIRSR